MSNYRRNKIKGGHYFFTVVTYQRQKIFSNPNNIKRLREAFRHVMNNHPFKIDAIVIMPDHIHTIWTLAENEDDYSTRWRLIKHYVSIGIDVDKNQQGKKKIWQARFWEHTIVDETDWNNHMDYIHYNPVKHGFVTKPTDWEYSSIHQAIKKGEYDSEWGNSEPEHIKGIILE